MGQKREKERYTEKGRFYREGDRERRKRLILWENLLKKAGDKD